MLLRKASLAKMRALTSLECSTSVCSRDGAAQSSFSTLLIALASFTSSSSRCFCSTNHHRRRSLKCLPDENVTFRKGMMFTAPSSVLLFAANASSSAGNNNNCDESSEREKIQFDYSENTDPVVNENFIAPNFGYKRQYKGEISCIFGWRSRECVCRRHTFTHLSSLLFLRDDIKNSWSRYTQHGRTVSGFRNHHNLRGDVVVCQRHLSIGSDDGRVQRCWDFRESERDFDRPRWTYVSV